MLQKLPRRLSAELEDNDGVWAHATQNMIPWCLRKSPSPHPSPLKQFIKILTREIPSPCPEERTTLIYEDTGTQKKSEQTGLAKSPSL